MRNMALIAFGVLIALAGLGAYWYWTTTPRYALWTLDRAVRTGDPGTFDRHVDMDSIITASVKQTIDAKARETGLPLGRLFAAFPGAPLGKVAGGVIRETLRDQILTGPPADGALSIHDVAFADATISTINETNARATIPITPQNSDITYEARVTLIRTGNIWRIIEVTNPETLLPLVEDYMGEFAPF